MLFQLSNTVDTVEWFSSFLRVCFLCDIVLVVCCLMSAAVSLSYVPEASIMAVRCCLLFCIEASFCHLSNFSVCTCSVHRHSLDAQVGAGVIMQKFMMQLIACLNFSCKWAVCPLHAKC